MKNLRLRIGLPLLAALAAACTTTGSGVSAWVSGENPVEFTGNEAPSVRNVILLSDARADSPDWQSISDILVRDGYNVSIVAEPLTSVEDEVAATRRVIGEQDGQCILVAHRYAGPILTEAATDPSVAALVFVAGHVPEAGPTEVAALVEQAASEPRGIVAAPQLASGAGKIVSFAQHVAGYVDLSG